MHELDVGVQMPVSGLQHPAVHVAHQSTHRMRILTDRQTMVGETVTECRRAEAWHLHLLFEGTEPAANRILPPGVPTRVEKEET